MVGALRRLKPRLADKRQENGYIAVMTVLILGAVATAIGITLLLTGTDAQRITLGEQQSRQARSLAIACGQEALQQVHDNIAFTANNTSMSLGQGSCRYSVGVSGGSARLISASGTVGGVTRKIQANVTINASTITVGNWQDMPDRYATVSYVQGTTMTNDAAATTAPVTMPANVTTGNFIVVAVSWDTTATQSFSCSDTRGNAYTNIGTVWNDTTNTQGMSICYAQNISGNAADTVTVTFAASSNFRRVVANEYSGVATVGNPVDGVAGVGGLTTVTSTDGTSSGNITTTQDGDLVFSAVMITMTTRGIVNGTGFSPRLYTGLKDMEAEDKQQPQAGVTAGTWTMPAASDKVDVAVVAFKPAPLTQ